MRSSVHILFEILKERILYFINLLHVCNLNFYLNYISFYFLSVLIVN